MIVEIDKGYNFKRVIFWDFVTYNYCLEWMYLDISDPEIDLESCNIHDGDTVALEEIYPIGQIKVEAG